jgi:hypothetical protein
MKSSNAFVIDEGNACMDWVGNDIINVSIEHCTNEVNVIK